MGRRGRKDGEKGEEVKGKGQGEGRGGLKTGREGGNREALREVEDSRKGRGM